MYFSCGLNTLGYSPHISPQTKQKNFVVLKISTEAILILETQIIYFYVFTAASLKSQSYTVSIVLFELPH
jgi:hypothetical protein